MAANSGSAQIGATDIPSISGSGTITMIVTVTKTADNSIMSNWTIKQKYYRNGGAALIGSTPDEEIIDDNIGLTKPTMSFIGTYPSTPIQVVCNISAHITLSTSWAVKFIIDSVGN